MLWNRSTQNITIETSLKHSLKSPAPWLKGMFLETYMFKWYRQNITIVKVASNYISFPRNTFTTEYRITRRISHGTESIEFVQHKVVRACIELWTLNSELWMSHQINSSSLKKIHESFKLMSSTKRLSHQRILFILRTLQYHVINFCDEVNVWIYSTCFISMNRLFLLKTFSAVFFISIDFFLYLHMLQEM